MQAGTVVGTSLNDYDPYGNLIKTTGAFTADFGYAGTLYEPNSGLDLTLYRAYSSRIGRWLSRDPLGEAAGPNLFAYVGGNPTNLTDPLGRFGFMAKVGEAAAAALNAIGGVGRGPNFLNNLLYYFPAPSPTPNNPPSGGRCPDFPVYSFFDVFVNIDLGSGGSPGGFGSGGLGFGGFPTTSARLRRFPGKFGGFPNNFGGGFGGFPGNFGGFPNFGGFGPGGGGFGAGFYDRGFGANFGPFDGDRGFGANLGPLNGDRGFGFGGGPRNFGGGFNGGGFGGTFRFRSN